MSFVPVAHQAANWCPHAGSNFPLLPFPASQKYWHTLRGRLVPLEVKTPLGSGGQSLQTDIKREWIDSLSEPCCHVNFRNIIPQQSKWNNPKIKSCHTSKSRPVTCIIPGLASEDKIAMSPPPDVSMALHNSWTDGTGLFGGGFGASSETTAMAGGCYFW